MPDSVTHCFELPSDRAFTFEDMLHFATEAWGALGTNTAHKWRAFNHCYFADTLSPVPIVLTHTLPFGRRIAFCSYTPGIGRTITLNVPKIGARLVADNATLLHEIVHQCLFERGEDAAHAGEPWRREIMRLNPLLTGNTIWAGQSKTVRRDKKVVRINAPNPDTGTPSLTQKQIARWPHDQGIALGRLGHNT